MRVLSDRVETRFTREYGVRHPIVLAPMAFVGTAPGLAIAVSRAGGLGSLAAGPLPAETVRGLVRAVRDATGGPLGVNFITFLANRAQIQACIDEGVPVVSFHWGHPPREAVTALHAAGIKVWEQVGSITAAREAVEAGIDLIIAQGSEAGGADAVSIGTRFIASDEAFAHAEYKRRLVAAAGTDTRLSSVYGPDLPHFNPMRVLDVGLAREFAAGDPAPTDLRSQPIIATMKLAGETIALHRFTSFVPTPDTEGRIDELPFLAGQGVGLVHAVVPVAQIVDGLMTDAVSALAPQP